MTTAGNKSDDLTAALKAALASSPREPRKRHGAIREAVAANLDDLLALREQLFTDAEIADIFRAKGFPVSAGTLKTYINALRAEKHGPQRVQKKAKESAAGGAMAARKSASDSAKAASNGPRAKRGTPSDLATQSNTKDAPTPGTVFGHRLDDDV